MQKTTDFSTLTNIYKKFFVSNNPVNDLTKNAKLIRDIKKTIDQNSQINHFLLLNSSLICNFIHNGFNYEFQFDCSNYPKSHLIINYITFNTYDSIISHLLINNVLHFDDPISSKYHDIIINTLFNRIASFLLSL